MRAALGVITCSSGSHVNTTKTKSMGTPLLSGCRASSLMSASLNDAQVHRAQSNVLWLSSAWMSRNCVMTPSSFSETPLVTEDTLSMLKNFKGEKLT